MKRSCAEVLDWFRSANRFSIYDAIRLIMNLLTQNGKLKKTSKELGLAGGALTSVYPLTNRASGKLDMPDG